MSEHFELWRLRDGPVYEADIGEWPPGPEAPLYPPRQAHPLESISFSGRTSYTPPWGHAVWVRTDFGWSETPELFVPHGWVAARQDWAFSSVSGWPGTDLEAGPAFLIFHRDPDTGWECLGAASTYDLVPELRGRPDVRATLDPGSVEIAMQDDVVLLKYDNYASVDGVQLGATVFAAFER